MDRWRSRELAKSLAWLALRGIPRSPLAESLGLQHEQGRSHFLGCFFRGFSQLCSVTEPSISVGGEKWSQNPTYSPLMTDRDLQDGVPLPSADTPSAGRYLRDPKEWVWLPPVPHKLSEWPTGHAAESDVGAFQWLRKCQEQLPHAVVHKLFRKREVRLVEEGKSPGQPAVLRRISEGEALAPGSVLVIHARAVEPRASPKPRQQSDPVPDKPAREPQIKNKATPKGVTVEVPPEVQDLRERVLFRDEHVVVLNKAHGLAVQGGRGVRHSLDGLLTEAFAKRGGERPRLVHRLDKDTSGCLVVALSEASAAAMTELFRQKTADAVSNQEANGESAAADSGGLRRTYWALVEGVPAQKEGVIDAPIKKCPLPGKGERMELAARQEEDAIPALTRYRVLATSPQGFAWLELQPLTGRKHQLRVHASYVLSCPVVGDYKYGFVGQVRRGRGKDGTVGVPDVDKKERGKAKKAGQVAGMAGSKSPHLHLHCQNIELPKLYMLGAPEKGEGRAGRSKTRGQRTRITAPLPAHMDASWRALRFPSGGS